MAMTQNHTVPSQIIAEAADWLVRSQGKTLTASEQQQLAEWCARSEQHQRAWSMARNLTQSLQEMPPGLGKPVLNRKQFKRRDFIKMMTGLAIVPAGGWLVGGQLPLEQWTADLSTDIGEQRQQQLADGSRLLMNTQTAVDVEYSAELRRIRLHRGEIQLTTAPDKLKRPFIVTTEFGDVEALGTVFQLRHQHEASLVSVQQDAVEIRTFSGIMQRLSTGQQSEFTHNAISPPIQADPLATAWVRGQLIADDNRLGDVLAELARYRQGWLRCDPAAADLRVSGVFQLNNTDAALQNIAKTLPVDLAYRTRFWVMITKISSS
jgi:transmembrane sensor